MCNVISPILSVLNVLVVQAARIWAQPASLEHGHEAQWVLRTFRLVVRLHLDENGTNVQAVLSSDTLILDGYAVAINPVDWKVQARASSSVPDLRPLAATLPAPSSQ
jgi:hypothetical protein